MGDSETRARRGLESISCLGGMDLSSEPFNALLGASRGRYERFTKKFAFAADFFVLEGARVQTRVQAAAHTAAGTAAHTAACVCAHALSINNTTVNNNTSLNINKQVKRGEYEGGGIMGDTPMPPACVVNKKSTR